MRSRILHIFSLMLLLVFLVFSSGIKLVEHRCEQCGIRELAIFSSPEACCATTATAPSCCTTSEAPACSTDGCCEHEAQYLALEDSYVPSSCKFLVQSPAQANHIPILSPLSCLDENAATAFQSASPPAPLAGKTLLIAVQQLKIACIC